MSNNRKAITVRHTVPLIVLVYDCIQDEYLRSIAVAAFSNWLIYPGTS